MVLLQNTSRLNDSHEIFVWVAPPEPRVREARVFGDVPKIMKLWNLVPKFPISSGNTEGTVMDEEPPDVSVERCALRRGEDVLIALEEGVQLNEGTPIRPRCLCPAPTSYPRGPRICRQRWGSSAYVQQQAIFCYSQIITTTELLEVIGAWFLPPSLWTSILGTTCAGSLCRRRRKPINCSSALALSGGRTAMRSYGCR